MQTDCGADLHDGCLRDGVRKTPRTPCPARHANRYRHHRSKGWYRPLPTLPTSIASRTLHWTLISETAVFVKSQTRRFPINFSWNPVLWESTSSASLHPKETGRRWSFPANSPGSGWKSDSGGGQP